MTHLYRTQTTGNRRTFTVSTWIKFGNSYGSSGAIILNTDGDNANRNFMFQLNSDKIKLHLYGGDAFSTSRFIRDYSGWYHVVLGVDTTQATASNRLKLYINGELQTITQESLYPSQNYDFGVGDNGRVMSIMGDHDNSNNYDNRSYLSHYHFCDGYQYQASDFGSTDATSGEWKINTNPSVSYGSTGFFLKFENSSNLTLDSGGNSISFSTSGTPIASQDNPSNVFAVWNPNANDNGNYSLSNGNLTYSNADNNWSHGGLVSTIGIPASGGKYYWEHKKTYAGNHIIFGLISEEEVYRLYKDSGTDIYEKINGVQCSNSGNSGLYLQNSSDTGQIGTVANGSILQCAYDADNRKLWYGINGTWHNSGDPANGTNETIGAAEFTADKIYFPFSQSHNSSGTASSDTNFGNGYFGTSAIASEGSNASGIGKFEYDVPNGFTALSTKGLNE